MTRSMQIITKHNFIVIGVAIVISICIFIFGRAGKRQTSKLHKLSYSAFYQPTGWGYNILVDDKIYIHQELVPGLPVKNGFRKKEYAEKAAQMVIQKMLKKVVPNLSENELTHICSIDSLIFDQQPVNH